jgi:hypothetical protein
MPKDFTTALRVCEHPAPTTTDRPLHTSSVISDYIFTYNLNLIRDIASYLRKMAPLDKAKAKKAASESINSRLALVMKSGQYCCGVRQTLKTLRLVSKPTILSTQVAYSRLKHLIPDR